VSRALIVGVSGQDGRILYDRLCGEGWSVLGLGRDSIRSTDAGITEPVDIADREQVAAVVARWLPERVFYLAAYHHSSQERTNVDPPELVERSHAVHVRGLVNVLDALRIAAPTARLFYAASSLVFGDPPAEIQDERTPLNPRCIYGITKAAGAHCCRFYRDQHGLFASVGILYNHESAYRQDRFVSRKIILSAHEIAAGKRSKLTLGDLTARIDWGYAPDFVDAMVKMLELPEPDDFVVATGEAHSVGEFVDIAFSRLALDPRAHVEVDGATLHRKRRTMIGDASKLRRATGWRPSVGFVEMVEHLLEQARGVGTPL
jgi:GDPmannose 4,6-dehydratase